MAALGAMFIMSAALLYSASCTREQKRRAGLYRQCGDMLERLSAELTASLASLWTVFSTVKSGADGPCRELLEMLCRSMSALGDRPFGELWAECWNSCMGEIGKERMNEIVRLGLILGSFDTDNQREAIASCVRALRADGETMERELRERTRLRTALSLSGAALAVILLI